jgi:hypothetical protein
MTKNHTIHNKTGIYSNQISNNKYLEVEYIKKQSEQAYIENQIRYKLSAWDEVRLNEIKLIFKKRVIN